MSANPPLDARSVVARAAVLDAVIVCRHAAHRLARLGRLAKSDDSPVTVADFAAQAVIVRRLREHGSAPIVGEESAAMLRDPANALLRDAVVEAVRPVWPDAEAEAVLEAIDGARGSADPRGHWMLDPIDGTRGFVRGGQYAVCLAWMADASPRLALMGCPNLPRELDASMEVVDREGTLFIAHAEGPVWWGPAVPSAALQPLEPLAAGWPNALVVTHSVESRHSRLDDMARALARLGVPVVARTADSQAKYGMVARGQADVYMRVPSDRLRAEQVWDHAPGCLVATAAGMRVTDLRGKPFDFSYGERLEGNYGVVCAPPGLHELMLEAIAALGLERREV